MSNYELESQRRHRRNYNKNHYYGPTAGKYERRPWEDNEERLIMFSRKSDSSLSKLLHRSIGSIQKRRYIIKQEGRPWLKNKAPVEKATPARKED